MRSRRSLPMDRRERRVRDGTRLPAHGRRHLRPGRRRTPRDRGDRHPPRSRHRICQSLTGSRALICGRAAVAADLVAIGPVAAAGLADVVSPRRWPALGGLVTAMVRSVLVSLPRSASGSLLAMCSWAMAARTGVVLSSRSRPGVVMAARARPRWRWTGPVTAPPPGARPAGGCVGASALVSPKDLLTPSTSIMAPRPGELVVVVMVNLSNRSVA